VDSLKSSVSPSAVENISIPVPQKAAPAVMPAATASELGGVQFTMPEPGPDGLIVRLALGMNGSWQLASSNPEYFKSAYGSRFEVQGNGGYPMLFLDNGVGGFVKKLSPKQKAEIKARYGINADYSLALCYGDYAEGKYILLVGSK
jgi:hypothetical protein